MPSKSFVTLIYINAFITGAIVMSFEMIGSRYINPYFGSGIFTWASIISTILMALMFGYFLGGWLADKRPGTKTLGTIIAVSSLYLCIVPLFAQELFALVFETFTDIRLGSLIASMSLMLLPVCGLGVYSPYAIRLVLHSTAEAGRTAGKVYGISTAGSIVGTLGTTFFLVPIIGTSKLTVMLGIVGALSGLSLIMSKKS